MKPWLKILIILPLVGLLAMVRWVEYSYFYDPFMYFFEQDFHDELQIPAWMFFNVFLRFLVNTIISLVILYVAFQSRGILKFSGIIYAGFFLVFFPLFVYLMSHIHTDNYLPAFYVRRFLAHPVLVLILLPAFYYYWLQQKLPQSRF